ncbi:MAG: GAF domain-containing protein [Erythrobacter sp.]|nr:GAF domain-containing protein [Erythrobacter sp.]
MNLVTTTRELTECDREPIHQIAAVQAFGGLLKMEGDWRIGHRSLNCAKLLGLAELPEIGARLDTLFTSAAMDALKGALVRLASKAEVERLFGLQLVEGGDLFDCALHAVNERIILEFEPHARDAFANHVSLIAPVIAQLEGITDLDTLSAKAATLVRGMLSYDRVMIYRFHPDESGEVIAEDARADLEPYCGLRFPPADIPQQARELFRRNRVRVIADVEAEPSLIDPPTAFGNRPLDMSMSVLRAHSKMHLRYLTNMGVGATLAMSIVCQGKLWGMISCHHMTPRLPSFSLRTVAETFSQIFSLIIDRMQIDASQRVRARGRELREQLMVNLADGAPLGTNVAKVGEMLSEVIAHDGLTVNVAGEFNRHGAAPSAEEFERIVPHLARSQIKEAYATTSLAAHLKEAEAFADRASGALFIPLSRTPYEFLILWRKPLRRTVTWAGDPAKAKAVRPGERLQPRESFAAWVETIEDQSADWSEDDLHIADGLRVTLLEVILRMSEEAARQRTRAQEQQELLIAELNHRVRNILNLIRSLVSQSQHDAIDVENFASIIGGRIAALASAHDNITQENWSPAPLSKLFESEIEAYLNGQSQRLILAGEQVLIAPEAYTVLALVVHELMTNSAKYGSLVDRSGTVTVEVSRTEADDLAISWRERGGPPVQTPTRRGFGSTIIERSIPFELKGEAKLRFMLTGLEADFVVPKRFVTPDPNATGKAEDKASIAGHAPRQGSGPGNDNHLEPMAPQAPSGLPRHMLVVEDSMIIALDIEENLRRAGVTSIDVASSLVGALSAIGERQPDLAIVDFNLGSESSLPALEELKRRGVPFVLATGYAELGEQIGELGAMGIVRKPYGRAEIDDVLSAFKTIQTSGIAAGRQPSFGAGE